MITYRLKEHTDKAGVSLYSVILEDHRNIRPQRIVLDCHSRARAVAFCIDFKRSASVRTLEDVHDFYP